MRALRVVVADGGLVARPDIVLLCERAHLDLVGEAVNAAGVQEVAKTRAADLVLACGSPDLVREIATLEWPSIALVPDAVAAKEYAEAGVYAVITPAIEPEMIASIARVAVARAADLAAVRGEADKLRDQLETRKLVERAKGVLMQRLGVTEEAAYKKMQRASQDENRKMRDIAESILSAERLYAEPPQAD